MEQIGEDRYSGYEILDELSSTGLLKMNCDLMTVVGVYNKSDYYPREDPELQQELFLICGSNILNMDKLERYKSYVD